MRWQHEAACLGEDPQLFLPIGSTGPALDQVQQAKQACGGCAVKCFCLEWALLAGIDHGVRGRLAEEERRLFTRRATAAIRTP